MAGEMGARIGLDEVAGKLGTGGMSEVYRAHDTTLDRDVARKLLPEPFTANPDRLTRFQREFRGHWVAASLERRL